MQAASGLLGYSFRHSSPATLTSSRLTVVSPLERKGNENGVLVDGEFLHSIGRKNLHPGLDVVWLSGRETDLVDGFSISPRRMDCLLSLQSGSNT